MLLNESGRGIYSQGSYIKPINLYSSQAYVDCISSPDGSAISFISDPFSASGKDVVAFSCRAGSVIPVSYTHLTYARASAGNPCTDRGVDECNTWGDYFYMEALTRLVTDWEPYWY